MKIEFDDGSYVELSKSSEANKIILTISARDYNDSLKTISNSVEITIEQLNQLLKDLK